MEKRRSNMMSYPARSALRSTRLPPGIRRFVFFIALCALAAGAAAQVQTPVVDIPTRPGVTQRFLYLAPERPRAAVMLYAGGDGGLRIQSSQTITRLGGNFLVRSRSLFTDTGLAVAVMDAPSDRQNGPHLTAFRQTPQHVEDASAVIAWLREQTRAPVWLIGTSNGTLSAAHIATQLSRERGGADGIVLTATVLVSPSGRTRPVTNMPLDRIAVPVLLAHHKKDGCVACPFAATGEVMARLSTAPRKALLAFEGGITRGDPCEAMAHHGFNGIEREVVAKIADWIK
jgi:dienelactone hydrolase